MESVASMAAQFLQFRALGNVKRIDDGPMVAAVLVRVTKDKECEEEE